MAKQIEDKAGVQISSNLTEERLEKIRQRAHELYVARGQEEGHDLEDWLLAEAENEGPTASAAK